MRRLIILVLAVVVFLAAAPAVLADGPCGSGLTVRQPLTATASSSYSSSYLPEKAIDNSTSSIWRTDLNVDTGWLKVEGGLESGDQVCGVAIASCQQSGESGADGNRVANIMNLPSTLYVHSSPVYFAEGSCYSWHLIEFDSCHSIDGLKISVETDGGPPYLAEVDFCVQPEGTPTPTHTPTATSTPTPTYTPTPDGFQELGAASAPTPTPTDTGGELGAAELVIDNFTFEPVVDFDSLPSSSFFDALDLEAKIANVSWLNSVANYAVTVWSLLDHFAGGGLLAYATVLFVATWVIRWIAAFVFQRPMGQAGLDVSGAVNVAEDLDGIDERTARAAREIIRSRDKMRF